MSPRARGAIKDLEDPIARSCGGWCECHIQSSWKYKTKQRSFMPHSAFHFEKHSSLEPENSASPPITKNSWFSGY